MKGTFSICYKENQSSKVHFKEMKLKEMIRTSSQEISVGPKSRISLLKRPVGKIFETKSTLKNWASLMFGS